MRFLKDSGFVVKRVNVGEYDRYITVFTKDSGKIELIAKGVRRINSKRSSHIELLNHINFQAVKGPKNLVLTEVQMVRTYQEVKKNLDDLGCLFLISELIDKLCPMHQKSEQIFSLIHSTMQNPMDLDQEKWMFNFEVNLLSALGFWDPSKQFQDLKDLQQYIESIIERKLKTNIYFNN